MKIADLNELWNGNKQEIQKSSVYLYIFIVEFIEMYRENVKMVVT